MIKLDSNFNTLEHSSYPAMMSEPSFGDSLHTMDITCKGFNERTGVGIKSGKGYPCTEGFVNDFVRHIRPDTFRVVRLPEEYEITFQQHPDGIQELVTDDRDNIKGETGSLSISIFERELQEFTDELEGIVQVIEEETQAKVQDKLQELLLAEPVLYKLTQLEAFDEVIKRAREWWFTLTTSEARKAKVSIFLSSYSTVGALDMVRMYLSREVI
jgi:hypothetical protein